ncbi:MAG: DUF4424 domain-containing protein [Caulobacter sp.]|nr:DUF4424 domain-containing protein [Caulobacter sp.]
MKHILLAALLGAALAAPAAANDSTAELAAGGLVLTRTDAIVMKSEDLYISADEVRVRYVFLNTSGKAVTTRVAFPMPDIGGPEFFFHDTNIPGGEDPANLLAFVTRVDGAAVRMDVEQKAFVGDVDRTAWLIARGLPLALHVDGMVERLDALPPADQTEAVRLGLAIPDEYDAGRGWETHYNPAWILKTTFHWEQTFPAGKEIVVEHSYRPATGGSVGTIVGSPFMATPEWAETRDRYCIDSAFLAGVKKAQGKSEYPPFTEQRIAYVLKTGGNWAGPIGDFRMVIDKGTPANLVSFCASGVKKIGPTTFEVRKTNWTPDRDLSILILKPLPPVE